MGPRTFIQGDDKVDLKEIVIQELEREDRRRFDGDDNMAICITIAMCFQALIDKLDDVDVDIAIAIQNLTNTFQHND